MELRLALFLVICCWTVNTGWCVDQDTQSLVDRLGRSTATNFTTASDYVYHMEIDLYRPGHVIYTDRYSLKTSDGTSSAVIAWSHSFESIYGFTQISDKRLVVADLIESCLRVIDRHTDLTSVFSGQCGSAGYSEGRTGRFIHPWSVIRDNNYDGHQLLVTDTGNQAVRTVEVSNGGLGTFVKSYIFMFIRYLTQDDNGDVFVVTSHDHTLYRVTYREKIITAISGSSGSSGYRDSSLLDSLFYYPQDLVFIGNQALLLADTENDKIRIVDLTTDKVSTLDLCSGCHYEPVSLLITNHSLYIGQSKRIQQFIYPNLTTTPTTTTQTTTTNTPTTTTTTHSTTTTTPTTTLTIPTIKTQTTTTTTSATTTTTPTTTSITPTIISQHSTSRAPCQDRNMTFYVRSDEERALVGTAPDQHIELAVGNHIIHRYNCTMTILVINNGTTTSIPCQDSNLTLYVTSAEERAFVKITPYVQSGYAVGSHVIKSDNCTTYVIVINNGTTSVLEECPEVLRGVVSASTGFSALVLTLDGTTHTLELPVGVYNYRINGENTNCSLKVEIKDYFLVRGVDLVARYDNVKCTVLSDVVALSTLTTLANGYVNQIRELCQQDCSPKVGSQAKLSCKNDTLTVTWSTDVTFDGTVTEVPDELKQRLTDRLVEKSRYPTLSIVVTSRMPPLVYPTKTKDGAYAELMLNSSCLRNKMYVEKTDTCV